MKLHPFEGQQLTAPQIHALVPVMSLCTVQRKLKAGVTTRAGMLEDPSVGRRRGGRHTSKRHGWSTP